MNPWRYFVIEDSAQPFHVHPADRELVESYNARTKRAEFQLSTQLLPEPWVGRLNAQVVVLLANPGATEAETEPSWRPSEVQLRLAQQTLAQQPMEYPFYWLDPALSNTDGGKWYSQKLRWLVEATSRETVANNLLTLETHAYHSRQFDSSVNFLRTQEFQAQVLRDSIQRQALIVSLRVRKKFWSNFVPELERYATTGRVLEVSNPRQAALSPGNLHQFDALVSALHWR